MTAQDYGCLLAHSTRTEIVRRMDGDPVSPAKLAGELGLPVPQMAYHFRALVKIGALEPAGTRPRRGAVEHFYTARPGVRSTLVALLGVLDGST